jgi:hypothetical protein
VSPHHERRGRGDDGEPEGGIDADEADVGPASRKPSAATKCRSGVASGGPPSGTNTRSTAVAGDGRGAAPLGVVVNVFEALVEPGI